MKSKICKATKFFLIVLLCSLFPFGTKSQNEFKYNLRSVVYSFGKKDYNAANQNWSISQSPNGYMYFGNTAGLLEYNGKEWTLYELPDKLIVRSVFADNDGRIYTGAHEEFGYWTRSEQGKLEYHSLIKLLPETYQFSNEDIWNIKRIGRSVYFQSFSKVYAYNGKTLDIIKFEKPSFSIFEVNGSPLVSFIGGGAVRIISSKKHVDVKDIPLNLTISNAIRISPDSTLLITELNGIFLQVKNKFEGLWRCSANEVLKESHINKSALFKNKYIIIGTINNGIFLLDCKGQIVNRWNSNNGLQNNTILSIYVDKSQNIWAGLDKGIDYLKTRSPFNLFFEDNTSIGSVYCAALSNGKLYVGTNHGVFVSNWIYPKTNSLSFKPVEPLKGQVWSIEKINGSVLCGTNEGTFILEGEKATMIASTTGGNQFAQPANNHALLFQGNYTGISIFKKDDNNRYRYYKALANFGAPVKTLEFDHENTIWVGDIYKGLYRIRLNETQDTAVKVKKYGKADGFPSDYNLQVYKVGNTVVFTSLNQLYTYDYLNHKFIQHKMLNSTIGSYAAAHSIYQMDGNEYWLAKNNSIKQFFLHEEKLKDGFQINYRTLGTSAVDGYENIWKLDQSTYLLGLDNGFIIYNSLNSEKKDSFNFKPIVYKVETISNNGEVELATIYKEVNKVAYNRRNIIIHITTPGEIDGSHTYFYKFDDGSAWVEVKDSKIAVSNLNVGKHMLFIKSVDRTSSNESVSEFSLKILPPWYGHPIAMLLYLILIYIIYKQTFHINEQRLRKQKYEDLKKMKELKRIHMENMQREHLQQQVESKANELANYTMLIRTKNEVLQKIKNIVDDPASNEITSLGRMKKSILHLIDKNLTNNKEWEQFQSFFDEANKAFTTRLKKLHTDLTPNDLRFCSFLRMNLNSKEISQLLNISERSVEVKRYRLRKRLNIEHDTNLTKYMMDL